MGIMIPKMMPLWLAKFVIQTGIYQLFMRKFMKLSKLTLKEALDGMTDDADFKAVVSYIFGDIGKNNNNIITLGCFHYFSNRKKMGVLL
jgi:all-trans-retinol 13,14-reductase